MSDIVVLLHVVTSQFCIKCDVALHIRVVRFLKLPGGLQLVRFPKENEKLIVFQINNQDILLTDVINQPK